MITFYGLKTCDSCRKAVKALKDAGVSFDHNNVRVDGVPADLMQQAFDRFGDALVNKSSATWRGLTDDQKAGDMLPLLLENPTLMKRPLIVDGGQMTIGWKADAQAVWLK